MAITTTGGSGSTSSSVGSNAGTNLSLFTTPATSNATFLITVVCAGEDLGGGASMLNHVAQMKAGPSTAISYPLYNAQGVARTYYVSWSWVGVVVT
jgi:hypothetical protein